VVGGRASAAIRLLIALRSRPSITSTTNRARCLCGLLLLANALGDLATEFGLTVPKGISKLEKLTVLMDADKTFPAKARQAFTRLFDQFRGSLHTGTPFR
jgi:hypothetical protein